MHKNIFINDSTTLNVCINSAFNCTLLGIINSGKIKINNRNNIVYLSISYIILILFLNHIIVFKCSNDLFNLLVCADFEGTGYFYIYFFLLQLKYIPKALQLSMITVSFIQYSDVLM